ncbi:hypothetical protein AB0L06_15620 [Spirillospora sp. NPDC052269]
MAVSPHGLLDEPAHGAGAGVLCWFQGSSLASTRGVGTFHGRGAAPPVSVSCSSAVFGSSGSSDAPAVSPGGVQETADEVSQGGAPSGGVVM